MNNIAESLDQQGVESSGVDRTIFRSSLFFSEEDSYAF